MGRIGSNQVSVPDANFRAEYDPERNQVVGFIVPNRKATASIGAFAVSVDQVEQATGLYLLFQEPIDMANYQE